MRNRTRVKRNRGAGRSKLRLRRGPSKADARHLAKAGRKAAVKREARAQPREQHAPGTPYDQGYNRGYDHGHSAGYREGLEAAVQQASAQQSRAYEEGWEAGHHQGYDEGFRNGKHEGGDAIVDRMLAAYQVLPETSMEEIVAAGIGALRPRILHLLTAEQVGERIVAALDSHARFSLVRLGDGELLTLAQETVMPIDRVRAEGGFLEYAGVKVPDLAARDRLAEAVKRASVIGIPKLRQPNFQPLAFAAFRAFGIDYRSLALTDSLVNYYLYHAGYLSRITQGRRVLVIGNKAAGLAEVLATNGVAIAGVIASVCGVGDVPRVLEAAACCKFDVALVSAGISAVLIAEHIATVMGKVAIDFGHLADAIEKGEAPFR